jgi:sec-independent protein translocase protein TatB
MPRGALPVLFDLSFFKLLVLAVIALVVFGPERLPSMAAQAGRALRELRRMAEGAKSELQENLGPEFGELSKLDLADLNPKRFVRKHLMDELTGDGALLSSATDGANGSAAGNGSAAADNGNAVDYRSAADYGNGSTSTGIPWPAAVLSPGERPPYDAEAT